VFPAEWGVPGLRGLERSGLNQEAGLVIQRFSSVRGAPSSLPPPSRLFTFLAVDSGAARHRGPSHRSPVPLEASRTLSRVNKTFEVRRSEPVHKLTLQSTAGGRREEGREEGGTSRGGVRHPCPM